MTARVVPDEGSQRKAKDSWEKYNDVLVINTDCQVLIWETDGQCSEIGMRFSVHTSSTRER